MRTMARRVALVAMICLTLLSVSVSYAHSGGTDSDGGHYDRSTGEYHYHHGYPAHQHENGVCPYDDVDATETRSSPSYTGGSTTRSSSKVEELEDKVKSLESDLRETNDALGESEYHLRQAEKNLSAARSTIATQKTILILESIAIAIPMLVFIVKRIRNAASERNGKK